ncbi:2644_t:CDS:2, partial [Entrophospora sp. SA101]
FEAVKQSFEEARYAKKRFHTFIDSSIGLKRLAKIFRNGVDGIGYSSNASSVW